MWRSLKEVQTELDTYAIQQVQDNEKEAHENNHTRVQVILNFKGPFGSSFWVSFTIKKNLES